MQKAFGARKIIYHEGRGGKITSRWVYVRDKISGVDRQYW
jgi:hypothetical protein